MADPRVSPVNKFREHCAVLEHDAESLGVERTAVKEISKDLLQLALAGTGSVREACDALSYAKQMADKMRMEELGKPNVASIDKAIPKVLKQNGEMLVDGATNGKPISLSDAGTRLPSSRPCSQTSSNRPSSACHAMAPMMYHDNGMAFANNQQSFMMPHPPWCGPQGFMLKPQVPPFPVPPGPHYWPYVGPHYVDKSNRQKVPEAQYGLPPGLENVQDVKEDHPMIIEPSEIWCNLETAQPGSESVPPKTPTATEHAPRAAQEQAKTDEIVVGPDEKKKIRDTVQDLYDNGVKPTALLLRRRLSTLYGNEATSAWWDNPETAKTGCEKADLVVEILPGDQFYVLLEERDRERQNELFVDPDGEDVKMNSDEEREIMQAVTEMGERAKTNFVVAEYVSKHTSGKKTIGENMQLVQRLMKTKKLGVRRVPNGRSSGGRKGSARKERKDSSWLVPYWLSDESKKCVETDSSVKSLSSEEGMVFRKKIETLLASHGGHIALARFKTLYSLHFGKHLQEQEFQSNGQRFSKLAELLNAPEMQEICEIGKTPGSTTAFVTLKGSGASGSQTPKKVAGQPPVAQRQAEAPAPPP